MDRDPREILSILAARFEDFLNREVASLIKKRAVGELAAPVLYSLSAGGKRLRPVLCMAAAGVDTAVMPPGSLYVAASLEAIHTYSLIHDDLPAMDDDDLRRGRPSCHKAFSESAAILAGDALNTLAFELVAMSGSPQVPALVQILASAAGISGMVCGQALDLAAERHKEIAGRSRDGLLIEIHRKKTAAMFSASLEMGAVLAAGDRTAYREYGMELGLLFQMTDDLLDETGDAALLGKTPGKDRDAGKLTYPLLHGVEKTRQLCAEKARYVTDLARALKVAPEAAVDYRTMFCALPDILTERVK